MHHVEIINTLIQRYGYKTYLEIGVANPTICFDRIIAPMKTGVDPELNGWRYDYRMESDEFFSLLRIGRTEFPPDMKWDLIFIDGLHLAEQVERDVVNSIGHLAEGGTIVMHDCSPPHPMIAREVYQPDYPVPGEWCGTTWKAFYKFRHTRPDLQMWCVHTDCGVGIIQVGDGGLVPNDNPYYSYEVMDRNRKEHLNLISPEEFLTLFGGKDV